MVAVWSLQYHRKNIGGVMVAWYLLKLFVNIFHLFIQYTGLVLHSNPISRPISGHHPTFSTLTVTCSPSPLDFLSNLPPQSLLKPRPHPGRHQNPPPTTCSPPHMDFKTPQDLEDSPSWLCAAQFLLCDQTLRHAEITFGLCVHWITLLPPHIKQQWG